MKHLFLGWVVLHGLMLPAAYWPRQRLTPEITIQRCSYVDHGRVVATSFIYFRRH